MERSAWRLLGLLGVLLVPVGCSDLLGLGGDSEPPRLEASSPEPGASEVSALAVVTLRFTAGIDPAGLSGAVGIESEGRRVAVGVGQPDERTVVLTPTDPLDFGSDYRVVLTPGLKSASGAALDSAASWTFTTRGLPPPTPSGDSLRRHLEALAHDSMRGRGSGSPDELKAARYLEERLLSYGLRAPAGGAIQPFDAFSRRGDSLLHSRNVMAQVPGSGVLADQWLVVGAHYDHIGFRHLGPGSAGPNNGADDNASGTVLVLELARMLQRYVDQSGMAGTDRRSVLFAGFGAEEEGLLGSCHYVFDAPAAPLSATGAMMNFDMVGRLRSNTLVVSGQETAVDWPALVTNANAPGISLLRPETSSSGGTDHACFWRAGIPWLGFFTGFHDQYHRPSDDVGLINFGGLTRIGELSFRILTRLLVMQQPPAFTGPVPGA